MARGPVKDAPEPAASSDDDDAPEPKEAALDALMEQAQEALEAKDFPKAETLAKNVLSQRPQDYPDAFVILGDVRAAVKEDTKALEFYERALAMDPADAWALVRECEALGRLDRKAEALQKLKAFVKDHQGSADQDVYDALGWAELDVDAAKDAEAAFRSALQAAGNKGDEDAYYGLALIEADRGHARETARNLEACFALAPSRRLEASKDSGFDPVRRSPVVAALFNKKRLAEARSAGH